MSTPAQAFIDRLAALAQEARHHPQPAQAVALLAQLLLDVVTELQPLAQKYGLLLKASGFLESLERSVDETQLQLTAASLPGAQAGTYEDLQASATSVTGHDPDQDTTGTAG